jgi:ABC-2 type transport system ATP-binding protein
MVGQDEQMRMIQIRNLVKHFGDLKAVDDVSLEVREGEIFAFLGPNGAGKTTTIQMLTTLLRPTSGSMLVDGMDPVTQPLEVRRRFGIVFQDPSLDFDLTAYENMEIHAVLYDVPRRDRAPRIEMLLKLFDLWDRRAGFVRTFSGGMKRRLEVARGLLHRPKILFLDEPTLGLDPQSRHQLWNHVKHLNETESVTVLLTTHYMDECERVAHRVAIIDHGRIVAMGTPAELCAQTGVASLEKAFLVLTGSAIREERSSNSDQMRQVARVLSGGRR